MMQTLLDFILRLGVPVILAVVYAESGLLIGFLFPGDSLLFTAGAFARSGVLPIPFNSIELLVLLVAIAAILGDSTGYGFGKKIGRRLFQRENARFFKKEYLEEAEKFYDKYGAWAIILARFVPIVRTFAPIIAGVGKMSYRTFIVFNVIGGALWSAGFVYLGYFVGDVLIRAGINIELVTIAIIIISILPMAIHALSNEKTRKKISASLKYQFDAIFRRSRKK